MAFQYRTGQWREDWGNWGNLPGTSFCVDGHLPHVCAKQVLPKQDGVQHFPFISSEKETPASEQRTLHFFPPLL